MRYILECIWSGYTSSQMRPCHRKIIKEKYKVEKLKKVSSIRFTDGTNMTVHLRPCKFKEKIDEINGYNELFDKIIYSNKNYEGSVSINDIP